jgi:hypothetical protein
MRKGRKGGALHADDAYLNCLIAKIRAPVEHPFRVLKRQFGYIMTLYRGLAKNRAQLFSLFALGNLDVVCRRLSMRRVAPAPNPACGCEYIRQTDKTTQQPVGTLQTQVKTAKLTRQSDVPQDVATRGDCESIPVQSKLEQRDFEQIRGINTAKRK